ncbi:hypothetical protein DFP72DRAFT_1071548 [Ephemerocybe angulata]|uniref:Uncharacterized protein n=1 Tax=Ephemerocybe angulata TaxID=980116 RepID=A0A8H6M4N6_9AGAR|nr:hypothetical protein DFP72DRAFT_1071548 [Tulosesus angulatus]
MTQISAGPPILHYTPAPDKPCYLFVMRPSSKFAFLVLSSHGLLSFALPVGFSGSSISDLSSREIESGGSTIEVRGWEPRSLSEDELLELEARGLEGIGKLVKAAAAPIKKAVSALRPSSRKPAPAPPARKPKSKTAASSKGKTSKANAKSTKKAAKKAAAKNSSTKKSASAKSKTKSKGKSRALAAAGTKKAGSSKAASGKSKSKGKSKGKSGTGKAKKSGKDSSGKDKGKSSGKKGKKSKSGKKAKDEKPTRSRSRTFNVNVDPGNLINGAVNLANLLGGGN